MVDLLKQVDRVGGFTVVNRVVWYSDEYNVKLYTYSVVHIA